MYTVVKVVEMGGRDVRVASPDFYGGRLREMEGYERGEPFAKGELIVTEWIADRDVLRYVRRAEPGEKSGDSWENPKVRDASPSVLTATLAEHPDALETLGGYIAGYVAEYVAGMVRDNAGHITHEVRHGRETVASYSYTRSSSKDAGIGVTVTVTGTDLADMKQKFATARDQLFREVEVLQGKRAPGDV